jgi:hypothetical protein
LGNSVDISCTPKDAASEVHIAINTSQNQTIGPFVIPSKAYLDLQQRFDALAGRIDDLTNMLIANKAAMAQTRVDINSVLPKIRDFGPGATVAFDLQGVTGGTGTHNPKNCGPGQVLAGFNPYVEDGHVKIVFNCQALPTLQMP